MSVRHLDAVRDALRTAGADALWLHPAVDLVHLRPDGPELLNAAPA